MSFWWYGRKRGGRRYLWQIDTEPFAIVTVIVFIVVAVALHLLWNPSLAICLSFVLLIGGLACLVVAKISLHRQGIWLSFGPGLMSRGYARLYKVACVLLGVGVLLILLVCNAMQTVR